MFNESAQTLELLSKSTWLFIPGIESICFLELLLVLHSYLIIIDP